MHGSLALLGRLLHRNRIAGAFVIAFAFGFAFAFILTVLSISLLLVVGRLVHRLAALVVDLLLLVEDGTPPKPLQPELDSSDEEILEALALGAQGK